MPAGTFTRPIRAMQRNPVRPMKHVVVRSFAWSLMLSLPIILPAVETTTPPGQASAVSPLFEALKFREQVSRDLLGGTETRESALKRLRAHPAPIGQGLTPDAEYAFAVVEIAQRLAAAGRHADAEGLFRESEEALGRALASLRKDDTHERVLLLRKRAMVRSYHLGKGTEAKADFDEAVKARPGDKAIVRQRDLLLSRYGELNRAAASNQN